MKTSLKNVLIIPTIILFSSTGWSQSDKECSKYKTGKFEIDNGDGTISVIERNGHYQIETASDGKTQIKDSIVWIDDCTYKLVTVEATYKSRKMKKVLEDNDMYFEFIEILDHAYVVRISSESLNFVTEAKVYEAGFLNYDRR